MTMSVREAHRHADRILELVRSGKRELGDDAVRQSWSRCVNEYQLHPAKPHEPIFIKRAELEDRRERRADVIACARYEMTTLYQQLADVESAVVLTDTDGVIVHMVSSPEFAAEVGPLGLRVGGMWSETATGTNGMGTCLAAGGPVTVRREDHFFTQFAELTCSAVPVYDPSGDIAAVLDVTSRSSLMQQHLLVLLGMTARMIENRLIDLRFRNAHPLHFHSRPEFVYTLHEGKLAVRDDGRILAANRSALFQLGLQSMDDIRSRRIEDLFQTSLEDMLQRSMSSSFHPVVTYRANAALRFFAVARRPASDASASPPPARVSVDARSASAQANRALHATRLPAPRTTPVPAEFTFKDPRLVAHLETARRVIARQTPVLLCGETGSGKEVFARAVHDTSPHAGGAFVAVNCASLPESLIEAELFGYRAGAFTGAQRTGRRGKIVQADGGTLFLDEIADMPLELQARLLRVLDERQVAPLGTEDTFAVDFQLISASHEHLPARVHEGRFREDLYYRLAGIELVLPPLRERTDRRELIASMLASETDGKVQLTADAQQLLLDHSWPGNIRELRHVLRTAAALADGEPIAREHLPSLASLATPAALPVPASSPARDTDAQFEVASDAGLQVKLNPIQANERKVLLQLLEQHRWNVSNVAKALDVSRNTLYRKLHKLHIEVSHPE